MQPLTAPERPVYQRAPRRDPAPSRWAYRMHRLWLTPLFRSLMRVGLPAFAAAMAVGIYLGDADRRAALVATYAEVKREMQDRPAFMVTLMAIDGASDPVAEAVRKMLPIRLPTSSFNLDLEAMRATIAQIDAVASTQLRIRPGGVLEVAITERVPAVLWRSATGLEMLDATGHRVATLTTREARADLPLIAGEGAEDLVPEAMQLFAAAEPIYGRVRGLVRVGERRWDVVLDRDQRILLPEESPVAALERVIALDQAQDMLGRDLVIVDMRNEDRPTIRMSADAVSEMRRMMGLETKVSGQ
jgi:cell division protein FtsQ